MQELNAIREAVIGGLHREIEARIGEATAAGVPPAAVMNDGLIAAMDEVGWRYGAGEIFVPDTVRHLVSGKAFTFSDRGEHALKGFDDAVRLYEVRWQE